MNPSMDFRVQRIIAVLEGNIHRMPQPNEIARMVNLSVPRLRSLFKAETGESLARYQKSLRMRKAVKLLEETFLNVKEITQRVGIYDESHFVRDFKRIYGLTPTKYRARNYGRNDHPQALTQEARAIIKSAEPDEALTRIALGVVSTYARFDNTSALEALADAVKLINQSPLASPNSERAPQTKRVAGLTNTDITFGTAGFGLGAAIGAFDSALFENVLETLKKITTAELRGIALVSLCRKNIKPTVSTQASLPQPPS
jgi:AraC-like DNA-binding protein